ncbi:type VI secretion system baseplate subunit TssE [Bisgaard Taxon 10/6]|uniref:Type VI secretion system baseplate subunit TssE n=1 Tax=Exercitatus varius TaxID=67857 RepID=A0AAW6QBE9_9PAST|nr:type VI secretion system baseplate subunit TssE [Exercitatus varius]MDG2942761.1 type VI secretion system baseplate subunit TssE [Exercitatus varius]MDG2949453.1 type VI secretion system baseplate subunit TssE [Exercitatus varius]MDG2953071.1 type VI secretion system baseplate subunit TssE [Exercitatus varius]MDG2961376.1 type VI secretion system baseplate subunit TssE [Exercitatus varius]
MSFWNRLTSVSNNTDSIVRKTAHQVVDEVIRSVKKNIELVLNSRQGCTLCAPDFGLKDFNDSTATTRSLSQAIITDIRSNIDRYEPRVKISRIEYIPDPYDVLQLNFRLTCIVLLKQKNELTELNIILDSANKKFRVT